MVEETAQTVGVKTESLNIDGSVLHPDTKKNIRTQYSKRKHAPSESQDYVEEPDRFDCGIGHLKLIFI